MEGSTLLPFNSTSEQISKNPPPNNTIWELDGLNHYDHDLLSSSPMQCSPSQYPEEANLSFEELADCFQKLFCARLRIEIEKESKKRAGSSIGKIQLSALGGEEGGGASTAGEGDGEWGAAS